jgi:multidrug efflux pump subunit AcrB
MNLARISVKNSVTVNTVMCTIILLGLLSLSRLPREYMPDVTLNMAIIHTFFPGTSPEDVEKLITIPIEEEIKDVNDIDFIMSKSSEGRSSIFIRFNDMSEQDFKVIMQDLRSAVNKVPDLPDDAEDPLLMEIESEELSPALQVTITGELPEPLLKELADEFRDRLLEIDHIGKIELTGSREREIWVNVDPDRLYSYGLSIEQVAQALKATNFNMPGGTLEAGKSEYLIRTMGEYERPQAIENVIVRSDPEGKHVKIGHIAYVQDTFERTRTLSFFNREPGVSFNVSKKKRGSTITIVDQIKQLAREFEEYRLPGGCKVLITNDSSVQIRDAIRKLGTNAVMGTLFVIVLLCLFIGRRNALFAGLGIPVSLMCTFIFIQIAGGSLNISSLFALMMVIGIIVDDAIVIIENCYRYISMGMPPKEAAVVGTTEVMGPVFTACLTTVAAFMPLMLMPDVIGKFLRVVPIVVCLAICASLLEAFLILPSHIAEWSGKGDHSRVRERVINILKNFYTRQLIFILRRRYVFTASVFTVFVGCLSLIVFGVIEADMYKMDEISQFYVNVSMPEGTNLENTNQTLAEIEGRIVRALPPHEVDAFVTNVGMMITKDEWITNTAVGHIMVDLVEKKNRKRSIDEIIRQCRKELSHMVEPDSIEFFKLRAGPPVSEDIEVRVVGKYLFKIKAAVEEVKALIAQIPGVYDLKDDLNFGKKELKIYVDEDKAALYGIDLFRIASSIRNAYDGKVATVFREGDEEVDVVVKFDPQKVKNIEDIEDIKIMTPQGRTIPFRNLGEIKLEPGYTKIRHFKLDRATTIKGSVDKKLNSTVKVNREIKAKTKEIMQKYPGCRLRFEGAFREMQQAFSSLGQLFTLGIFLIYIILGAQFKSYAQPLIILITIPFALIGAIIALIVTNDSFSIVVLYGFVGLAGIAVNDAIVMISFINNARARGSSRWHSIVQSGRLRLRPILLTSITTMFGLLPMAVGLGGKSNLWAPMANTMFWGLGFAMVLTLFMLPTVYTIIVDDIGSLWQRQGKGPRA